MFSVKPSLNAVEEAHILNTFCVRVVDPLNAERLSQERGKFHDDFTHATKGWATSRSESNNAREVLAPRFTYKYRRSGESAAQNREQVMSFSLYWPTLQQSKWHQSTQTIKTKTTSRIV